MIGSSRLCLGDPIIAPRRSVLARWAQWLEATVPLFKSGVHFFPRRGKSVLFGQKSALLRLCAQKIKTR